MIFGKLAIALAALPSLAAPPSLAAQVTTPEDCLSLVAAADKFDRAQLAKDRATLQQMVMDDLVFIDGSGKRLGKKAFIDGWTTPGELFHPIVLIDRTIIPLGPDAGIVGAEVNLCGVSGAEHFCSHIRFADTFVLVRGCWRAAHIQVTRIKS